MALTVTQAAVPTFTTTAGSKTLTATPALGDLIIVIVLATGVNAQFGVTDNNTDGHGTYRVVTNGLKNSGVDSFTVLVRADLVRRAVSTVWTSSGDGASTGGGLAVYRIAGCQFSGPAAIKNTGGLSGAAGATPQGFFGSAPLTTDAIIGVVFNGTSPATLTPPATFTEDADVGYSTPTTGLETCHVNSGFTSTTLNWGSTSATAFGSVGIIVSGDAAGHMGEQQEEHSDPFALQVMDRISPVRSAYFCLGEKWARRGRLWVPAADRPLVVA